MALPSTDFCGKMFSLVELLKLCPSSADDAAHQRHSSAFETVLHWLAWCIWLKPSVHRAGSQRSIQDGVQFVVFYCIDMLQVFGCIILGWHVVLAGESLLLAASDVDGADSGCVAQARLIRGVNRICC